MDRDGLGELLAGCVGMIASIAILGLAVWLFLLVLPLWLLAVLAAVLCVTVFGTLGWGVVSVWREQRAEQRRSTSMHPAKLVSDSSISSPMARDLLRQINQAASQIDKVWATTEYALAREVDAIERITRDHVAALERIHARLAAAAITDREREALFAQVEAALHSHRALVERAGQQSRAQIDSVARNSPGPEGFLRAISDSTSRFLKRS